MRNITVAKSVKKNTYSEKRSASRAGLVNFHTLTKVSVYEQKVASGKIALKSVSKQILKLEKTINALKLVSGSEKQKETLPSITLSISGVNLTIDPSLKSLVDDPFIIEKTRRANLKFSKTSI